MSDSDKTENSKIKAGGDATMILGVRWEHCVKGRQRGNACGHARLKVEVAFQGVSWAAHGLQFPMNDPAGIEVGT